MLANYPTNWQDRAHAQATNGFHQSQEVGFNAQQHTLDDSSHEPDELRNISRIINNRFRISPPPVADYFNPILQGTHLTQDIPNEREADDALYSPTLPLDILHISNETRPTTDTMYDNVQSDGSGPKIVLALPVSATMFLGKKRRDASNSKSQSLHSYFCFGGDVFQAKLKRQKRKMEECDAKGGFIIPGAPYSKRMPGKTITDVEMAMVFGFERDRQITRHLKGKRLACASPEQPIADRNQKKNKELAIHISPSIETVEQHHTDLDEVVHLGLAMDISHANNKRDVVDPHQPPTSR